MISFVCHLYYRLSSLPHPEPGVPMQINSLHEPNTTLLFVARKEPFLKAEVVDN
jgi:hypothetical protein